MLIKLGPSPASKVAAKLGYDRTTTYYALLRMLEKNYINQRGQNNGKIFAATNPSDILAMHKEKQEIFRQTLPQLEALYGKENESIKVEIRQGKEGLRHLYRDEINIGGELLGFGVEDSINEEIDKTAVDQYFRDAQKKRMNERLLIPKGAKPSHNPIAEFRYIDEKYFQPTPIVIYGNKVVITVFKPNIQLIFIECKEIADSFRKHFEALWSVAEK